MLSTFNISCSFNKYISNFSLNETCANIFHETAERGTKSENALVTGSYRQKQKRKNWNLKSDWNLTGNKGWCAQHQGDMGNRTEINLGRGLQGSMKDKFKDNTVKILEHLKINMRLFITPKISFKIQYIRQHWMLEGMCRTRS